MHVFGHTARHLVFGWFSIPVVLLRKFRFSESIYKSVELKGKSHGRECPLMSDENSLCSWRWAVNLKQTFIKGEQPAFLLNVEGARRKRK